MFDKLVLPILNYGSQGRWLNDSSQLEKKIQFCKRAFRSKIAVTK